MRGLSSGVITVVMLSLGLGLAQAARIDAEKQGSHRAHETQPVHTADGSAYYIVRLKDAPVATYAGELPGYAATSPRYRGARILDVSGAASYAAYLSERQSSLLDAARPMLGRTLLPRFRYRYALNGMSVRLTPDEAWRIATLPGVVSVEPVRYFAPTTSVPAVAGDTNASRAWIDAPVVWQIPSNGTDNEGEGMVLADLDTGINHANSSFDATGGLDGYVAQDPGNLRFGVCDPSNADQHAKKPSFFACNDKLLGAYTYTQGTDDPNSPEDSEGHGSHTASTVVGDFVSVTLHGSATPLSGVAPHASVIMYDVCDPQNLCGQDSSVAAVEQAIQDQAALKSAWGSTFKGMVLNFSIGGGDDAYTDPVEQAFLSAVEAGIYVSASGGNGGPSNRVAHDPNSPEYPVEHLGPWVATNAAATHDGSFTSNDLENFSGGKNSKRPSANMTGAGFTAGFGPQPLVYSGDFASPPVKSGTAPTSGEAYPSPTGISNSQIGKQCLYPYPAHTFTSAEIVVCDRGTIALVDKAYNVMKGGAHGMVIATTSGSSQDLPVESYVIPATLIGLADGDALRAWISASSGSATPPQADISGSTLTVDPSHADEVAGFSSRGPTDTGYDDLVKPDLSGPGVSVLAAVADPAYADGCSGCANQPDTFDFFDGTSMSSPHDAGSAALLMQAHPAWTPSEVKSALMLTAVTTGITDQCRSLDSGDNCVPGGILPSPHVRGAGRIDVDAAERTGLVMDESAAHYKSADPAKGGDLTSLNLASLASDVCSPTCSWARKLSSALGSATVHYSVGVSGLSGGLQLQVSPASFTLAPGHSRTLTITADSTGVKMNKWAYGQVDITTSDAGDGGATVPDMHLPLAVEAVAPSLKMSLDETELRYSLAEQQSASMSFTISNNGEGPLVWNLAVDGDTAGASADCTGTGMPGLSLSAEHGTIAARKSTAVTATFDAGSLAAGDYEGEICATIKGSSKPPIVVTVRATVSGASVGSSGGGSGGSSGGGGSSSGSGGGGGNFSLLSLAVLAFALSRRLSQRLR